MDSLKEIQDYGSPLSHAVFNALLCNLWSVELKGSMETLTERSIKTGHQMTLWFRDSRTSMAEPPAAIRLLMHPLLRLALHIFVRLSLGFLVIPYLPKLFFYSLLLSSIFFSSLSFTSLSFFSPSYRFRSRTHIRLKAFLPLSRVFIVISY